jgi:hypothetical protein
MTERREHARITARMKRRTYYYRQWFYCANPLCRERAIYRDEHRVFNADDADTTTNHGRAP